MKTLLLSLLLTLSCAVSAGAENHLEAPADKSRQHDQTKPGKQDSVLRIGVRSEARPFSYRSDTLKDVLTDSAPGILASENYTGYIVRICDAVINEMMLNPGDRFHVAEGEITWVDVDTLRLEESGNAKSRFAYMEGDDARFDILCDPATITNERRRGFIISPPIYLTGVSYITLEGHDSRAAFSDERFCPFFERGSTYPKFLFGLVGNTTAGTTGLRAILGANEIPQAKAQLQEFLSAKERKCFGDAEDEAKRLGISKKGAVRFFKTHKQAAEAFCAGQIVYYVGDREIIVNQARTNPACNISGAAETFTVDRYAIYGRLDYTTNARRAMLVARFFEVLSQKIVSHPSILDQAFYDTFYPTQPTPALRTFFEAVRGDPTLPGLNNQP